MTKKRLGRLPPEERREKLLDVALSVAVKKGYLNLSRQNVAEAAKCSTGLITRRFGDMETLRREVMRAAIDREVLVVIAQGVAAKDKLAMKAPAELKARAAGALA